MKYLFATMALVFVVSMVLKLDLVSSAIFGLCAGGLAAYLDERNN